MYVYNSKSSAYLVYSDAYCNIIKIHCYVLSINEVLLNLSMDLNVLVICEVLRQVH